MAVEIVWKCILNTSPLIFMDVNDYMDAASARKDIQDLLLMDVEVTLVCLLRILCSGDVPFVIRESVLEFIHKENCPNKLSNLSPLSKKLVFLCSVIAASSANTSIKDEGVYMLRNILVPELAKASGVMWDSIVGFVIKEINCLRKLLRNCVGLRILEISGDKLEIPAEHGHRVRIVDGHLDMKVLLEAMLSVIRFEDGRRGRYLYIAYLYEVVCQLVFRHMDGGVPGLANIASRLCKGLEIEECDCFSIFSKMADCALDSELLYDLKKKFSIKSWDLHWTTTRHANNTKLILLMLMWKGMKMLDGMCSSILNGMFCSLVAASDSATIAMLISVVMGNENGLDVVDFENSMEVFQLVSELDAQLFDKCVKSFLPQAIHSITKAEDAALQLAAAKSTLAFLRHRKLLHIVHRIEYVAAASELEAVDMCNLQEDVRALVEKLRSIIHDIIHK